VQVTGQRDGARLLVTLESKQAEMLDGALERFQALLSSDLAEPGLLLGVQKDISTLSGQSGQLSARGGSGALPSPQRPSSLDRAVGGGGSGGGGAAGVGAAGAFGGSSSGARL
jgi:hypothetical protein